MAARKDPFGGYSLEALLGAAPISSVDKKPGIVGRIIGAPFRLLGALIRLPFRLVKLVVMLPLRLLRAILPPYRRRGARAKK